MSTTVVAPGPEQPPLSEGARLINTFVAPTKTFNDINRKASWFVPWLLMAIVSLAVAFAIGQKIGWAQMNENQMRMQPKRAEQMEKMPPDQRARAERIGVVITQAFTYAVPVLRLIFLAIVAGVLFLSFNFGAGADLKFGKTLAVVMYASLPEIIRAILVIIFLYAGLVQPDQFIPQNPIGTNLGVFFKPGSPMYALGSSVDIFGIWVCSLAAIGITCISRVKRGTAFAIVFGWYVLLALVGAGFAAFFS
jgi:hypothetical protein